MKIKDIVIQDIFGETGRSLSYDLDPEVNIITGGAGSKKDMLLLDIYKLMVPPKTDSKGQPVFSGEITRSLMSITFEEPDKNITWCHRDNGWLDLYSFRGVDRKGLEAYVQYYSPIDYFEGFGIDDIIENLIEHVLLGKDTTSTMRYNYMCGLNFALGLPKGPAMFYTGAVHADNVMVMGDKSTRTLNPGNMSIEFKFLLMLILSVPTQPGSIFLVDLPETGLTPDICSRLISAIRAVNNDIQIIMTSNNPAIGKGVDVDSITK